MNEEVLDAQTLLDKMAGSSDLPSSEIPAVQAVINQTDDLVLAEDLVSEPASKLAAPQEKQEVADGASISEKDADSHDLRTLISKMTLPQKIKAAMFGNSVCRGLLVRDSNKLVQLCVLKNPKIGIGEVEEFAKNTNVSEHVLRMISQSQQWMRSYKLKYNLVTNSKTPIDISLRWLKFLNFDDLKRLSKSKNVSQVVSTAAKKKVVDDERKR